MLTPAYLAGVSSEVVDVYAKVEQEIIDDIVRRTMKMGYVSEYSQWQMQKAREFGMFQQDVTTILNRSTITAGRDVKLIMAQAAKDALAYDDAIYRAAGLTPLAISKSPALQALVLQGTSNTLQLLSNFTKTTSIESYAAFQSILDRTYIKILSGAYSPQNAIHAAIKELASNGMEKVAFQSGSGRVHYENIDNRERVRQVIDLVLTAEQPAEIDQAVRGILYLYSCGKPSEGRKRRPKNGNVEIKEKQIYSYEHDAPYIYGAFLSQYGIDLNDIEYLHWWKFNALFKSLPDTCKICEIMGYRATDPSKIKDKNERNRIMRLKSIYDLPDNLTFEDRVAMAGMAFGGH